MSLHTQNVCHLAIKHGHYWVDCNFYFKLATSSRRYSGCVLFAWKKMITDEDLNLTCSWHWARKREKGILELVIYIWTSLKSWGAMMHPENICLYPEKGWESQMYIINLFVVSFYKLSHRNHLHVGNFHIFFFIYAIWKYGRTAAFK